MTFTPPTVFTTALKVSRRAPKTASYSTSAVTGPVDQSLAVTGRIPGIADEYRNSGCDLRDGGWQCRYFVNIDPGRSNISKI